MGQQYELLVLGPPADPSIYQATVFSAGAASALVIWDAFLTLEDEVNYIWSKPGRKHVKWIYLFSKWFGLLNQIGISIWRSVLSTCSPAPVSTCVAFFILEAVTFQSLQLCLDAILILRIWAVYQQRHRYIATAYAIVLFEVLTSVMTQAILVPKSAVDVTQSVLLFLTYRGKVLLQPAVRRSKIISVVLRDGMFAFGAVVGIVFMSLLYLLFNQVVVNVFMPWMPVVPSLLTPRMILNMQMAAEPRESTLEFTTDLGNMHNNEIQLSNVHEPVIFYESRDPA